MILRSRIHLTILAALLVALTGCADDDDDDSPRQEGATVTASTVAPTATAMALRSGPASFAGAASPGAATAVVAAQPFGAVEVVRRVSPAVVTVVNRQAAGFLGGDQPTEAGRGTGFIIDEQGHIVTNWHVVDGGDQFEVIFADGEKRPAELVGSDQLSDLAVVRVEGPLPAIVPFGNSDALEPGIPVLAIGSPLGAFTSTVTDGIVSALGRDLPGSPAEGAPTYNNLIQHNAAINPGNSGGPLFDYTGAVVGVNTLGIPEVPGQGIPVQGLFFAIPSNTVQRITAQLIEEGQVVYPYLGVVVQEITPELASQYDLPVEHGAFVTSVEADGPAAQAGVQEEDIIQAVGDQKIDAQTTFTEALFNFRPGDSVELTVLRGDEELKLQVTLGERPSE